jgi:hypothetical protein
MQPRKEKQLRKKTKKHEPKREQAYEKTDNEMGEVATEQVATCALFVWLISHQPTVLFSQNKPATSNQPAVLFSQDKPAPAISHQPNEQAIGLIIFARRKANEVEPKSANPEKLRFLTKMGKETTQNVLQSNYDSTIPKSFQKINRGGLP